MFDAYFEQVHKRIIAPDIKAKSWVWPYDEARTWPRTDRQIILNMDAAIELGHPSTESLSFLMWTDSAEKVNDSHVTIIGPDLHQMTGKQVPFGKIVLVKVHGFDEENAYQRFEQMDLLKFRFELEGFMIRSVPQDFKEWSRVSSQALESGFSLRILGNELIRELKKLEFVDEAEIIFITSSREDIRFFKPVAEIVGKAAQAMNKMFENLEYDCDSCNFKDVCDEIDGLRTMHKNAS